MELIIGSVAVAPIRKDPSHRSEMVSQLLFGETAEIIERKDEWIRIRTSYDSYEGWLTEHLVATFTELLSNPDLYLAPDLSNPVVVNNTLIHAPMGASFTGFSETTHLLWNGNYSYNGPFIKIGSTFNKELFHRTVQQWLNTPYLWGGRTFMGVDCSGFVQVVYKLQGIKLKRDAYLQARQGTAVNTLQEVQPGDLAFFHNREGHIIHVGILLSSNSIIHASGKVRIDLIDNEGIINSENGSRTHQLTNIRRFI